MEPAHANSTAAPPWRWTEGATDEALVAGLLHGAGATPQAVRAAARLLQRHGGLPGLFRAARRSPTESASPALQRLAIAGELCRRRSAAALGGGAVLGSPGDALDYLRSSLQDRGREVFMALFLDTRHRVIGAEDLFHGSIDGASVYPRVVAERALRVNAAAVIVAHNHPSGVAEPSLADQAITRRLSQALALLDIRLLDHFVIGDGAEVSLASRGLL